MVQLQYENNNEYFIKEIAVCNVILFLQSLAVFAEMFKVNVVATNSNLHF